MSGRTPLDQLGKAAIARKGWWLAHRYLILRRISQLSILAIFISVTWAASLLHVKAWENSHLLQWLREGHILRGNLGNSTLLDKIPLLDPIIFLQMVAAGLVGMTSTAIIAALIVTIFYALVGGRVFCSWACPVNMITDAARWTRRRLGIKGGAKIRRETRYFMLAAVLLAAFFTGSVAYELINPVSLTHRGLIFGMGLGWLLIAGIFAFDVLFARDGWCGHLCPMGALYGLIGSASQIRVRADNRAACDECMECYEVCPEMHVISPALKSPHGEGPVILSGDCTNCGRCIDICDEQVYHFGLRSPNQIIAAGRTGENSKREKKSVERAV